MNCCEEMGQAGESEGERGAWTDAKCRGMCFFPFGMFFSVRLQVGRAHERRYLNNACDETRAVSGQITLVSVPFAFRLQAENEIAVSAVQGCAEVKILSIAARNRLAQPKATMATFSIFTEEATRWRSKMTGLRRSITVLAVTHKLQFYRPHIYGKESSYSSWQWLNGDCKQYGPIVRNLVTAKSEECSVRRRKLENMRFM